MDNILITVLLVASLIAMAINATIFKPTLKDFSKEDQGLKHFFTYFPVFNILATLACSLIQLEDRYKMYKLKKIRTKK